MLTIEDVSKQLKEMQEAIQKAGTDNEARVRELVEGQLKEVLRSHPGIAAPARTLPFAGGVAGDDSDILASTPKEVQFEMDKLFILSTVLSKHPKNLKSYKGFRAMIDKTEFAKALDATTAGGVDEWVPTEMSPALMEKVRLALKVASIFPVIPMSSNPFELPVEVGNYNSFYHQEQTADTGQTLVPAGDDANISGKCTFTAKDHSTRVLFSKNATEDSIVPLMPQIQAGIIRALAQGREDAILNGDTAGTHEDTDTTGATHRRKMLLGLRALCNDNSSTATKDLSTLTEDGLLDLRALMGVYGANPGDIVWVVGFKGATALMKIDALKTLDKIGPRASIVTGQIGELLGSPVILSEYVRQDLNASGIYEAAQTKTAIYCVNKNSFGIGERSRPTAEFFRELYAASRQNAMIATERWDFQPFQTFSSNIAAATGLNVG